MWFGQVSKLGTGGNDFGSNKDGRRGRCYAVNSKRSIDLKTQFVAHVLISTPFCRNLLLPTNDFVGSGDNLLACGFGRFPSWGLGGLILEVIRMVKEDGAILSIQSIHLT